MPQIWQNYQTKSVEGLALPFLLNWLCGDITNLVGCLLTNQLPFQRNLAIYFNLVDLILIFQYAIYSQSTLDSEQYQILVSSDSYEHSESDERRRNHLDEISSSHPESSASTSRQDHHKPNLSHRLSESDPEMLSPKPSNRPTHEQDTLNDLDRRTLCVNSSAPSRSQQARGRSIAREATSIMPLNNDSVSHSLAHRSPSRTGATTTAPTNNSSRASVTSRSPYPIVLLGAFTFLVFNTSPSFTQAPTTLSGLNTRAWAGLDLSETVSLDKPETTWKENLGRLSGWLCAFLYLTSRLPQIWKNYRRKSVEGLSMSLFMMAFLGNLTYVTSVLSSPLAKTQPGYLKESVPFLIGSGGTLCFDLLIFIQSRIYRSPRSRDNSHKSTIVGTENLLEHTSS